MPLTENLKTVVSPCAGRYPTFVRFSYPGKPDEFVPFAWAAQWHDSQRLGWVVSGVRFADSETVSWAKSWTIWDGVKHRLARIGVGAYGDAQVWRRHFPREHKFA